MCEPLNNLGSLFLAHSAFWGGVLANFLGSVLAAILIWITITWFYEVPRTRTQKHELLAVSYALLRRELQAAAQYCAQLIESNDDQVSIAVPITQSWEVLHSTEALRYLPPTVVEKVVALYSMLFRMRRNIELTQLLMLGEAFPQVGENRFRILRLRTTEIARQVA